MELRDLKTSIKHVGYIPYDKPQTTCKHNAHLLATKVDSLVGFYGRRVYDQTLQLLGNPIAFKRLSLNLVNEELTLDESTLYCHQIL